MRLVADANKGSSDYVKNVVGYYYNNESEQAGIRKLLVQQINNNHSTILHHLAILGETHFFKILLAEGANFAIKDNEGNLPLHYALKYQRHEIAALLLEADNQYCKQNELTTQNLTLHQNNKAGESPLAKCNDLQTFNLAKAYEQKFLFDVNRSRVTTPKLIANTYTYNNSAFPYNLNFQDVVFSEPIYNWIANPIGQIIDTSYQAEGHRLCSGVNIGRGYYLTAGHCLGEVCDNLAEQGGSKYKISFNYQHAAIPDQLPINQAIQENLYNIERVVEHGICASDIDYAVFKLEPAAEKYFGFANISADIPKPGESVVIAHHPSGIPKKISLGQVSFFDFSTGKVGHTANTLKGSSGAPIGTLTDKKVFAVHVEGDENTQRFNAGVTIHKIAQESTYVDKIGGFGLFKSSNAKQNRAVNREAQTCFYQFQSLTL